jgi:hypothetical protein
MYFVYCYYPNSIFYTKYIIGIYQTIEEAQSRQERYVSLITKRSDDNIVHGICDRLCEPVVTFLRKYPDGDQFTEIS